LDKSKFFFIWIGGLLFQYVLGLFIPILTPTLISPVVMGIVALVFSVKGDF